MPRLQKDPLRPLTLEERTQLEHVARSQNQPAVMVTRAKSLLGVVNGQKFTDAARSAGKKSGDAVAHLVARFNIEGLDALQPRHGGGYALKYTLEQRQKILKEARRTPDRELDGTSNWSLTTLQRSLREQPGLETLSTFVILEVLHEAGLSWQRNRTWCETGTAVR